MSLQRNGASLPKAGRDGDHGMRKPEPLCTVAQVAEILNVSEKTVRRLIKKGRLRVIRIGGLLRIDPLDIQDLIRDHRSR
jgi:excisionase family DNA binding protein